jgi:hypothetical protein
MAITVRLSPSYYYLATPRGLSLSDHPTAVTTWLSLWLRQSDYPTAISVWLSHSYLQFIRLFQDYHYLALPRLSLLAFAMAFLSGYPTATTTWLYLYLAIFFMATMTTLVGL